MKKWLYLITILLSALAAIGQTTGDYRSNNTGNWSDRLNWQRFNGAMWATPSAAIGYPGQNSVPGTVTIRNGNTITLDVTPANNIGILVVGGGTSGTLNTTGNPNLTVNNSFTINNGGSFTFGGTGNLNVGGTSQINGTFTDNESSGTNTYTGLVTISSTGTWNTSTTTAEIRMYFLEGITNSGSFTAGGVQIGAGRTVTANADMTISSGLDADGDVTLAGTNTIFLTGDVSNIGTVSTGKLTITGALSCTSTASGGPLNITGDLEVAGTLTLASATNGNVTVGGNTLITGTLTDSEDSGINTFSGLVTLGTGGIWNTANVTTSGRIIFQNGIAHSGSSFTAGAATFNTTNQQVSGSGTLNFSGTVTVTGITLTNIGTISLSNTAAGTLTGTGTFQQGTNGVLNYSGQTITIATLNASGTGNTINYQRAGAQTIFNPVSGSFHHLTISGSGTKTLSGNADLAGNLTISGTAVFSVSTFGINLEGNWTNSSTNADPFVQGNQIVTFDGSGGMQTLSNTGDAQGTEFNNLVINNTYGTSPQISLGGSNGVIVAGTFTMTSGVINLNALSLTLGTGNTVGTRGTLSHGASASNGWMYNGAFIRRLSTGSTIADGNVAGFFPVGNSEGDFHPISVSCPATGPTTGGTISVTPGEGKTASDVSFADGGSTILRQFDAPWSVTTANGLAGGTYNLRIEGTGFGEITNVNDLRITLASGVVGTAGTNGGTISMPQVNRTGLVLANLSNNFYLSSVSSASPLPIELLFFEAKRINGQVELSWSTVSESRNELFVVLRSGDGENWREIGTLPGAGDSKERLNYVLYDLSPASKEPYYRLKQIDFDGTSSHSDIVHVGIQEELDGKIFPNPVREGVINVSLNPRYQGQREVFIYNLHGNLIFHYVLPADYGESKFTVSEASLFPSGIYLVMLKGEGQVVYNRLVIQSDWMD